MSDSLSFTDIRFLRKVRDINSNPEAYERTEKGSVPASTGAILKASDLTESEVRYRMGGSRRRGLADDGLTVVHEAEFDEETKTFGAKSVELTQEGIDVLTEFENENDLFDEDDTEDTPEIVKQLRGRVSKLEQQSRESDSVDVDREIRELRRDVNRIEQKVDSIQDDPYGAVDTDVVGHIKETIKRGQAMFYIFGSVFGIDVDRRVEDGSYPSAGAIEAERVDVYDALSSAGYSEGDSTGSGDSTDSSDSAGSSGATSQSDVDQGQTTQAGVVGEQVESGGRDDRSEQGQLSVDGAAGMEGDSDDLGGDSEGEDGSAKGPYDPSSFTESSEGEGSGE